MPVVDASSTRYAAHGGANPVLEELDVAEPGQLAHAGRRPQARAEAKLAVAPADIVALEEADFRVEVIADGQPLGPHRRPCR